MVVREVEEVAARLPKKVIEVNNGMERQAEAQREKTLLLLLALIALIAVVAVVAVVVFV